MEKASTSNANRERRISVDYHASAPQIISSSPSFTDSSSDEIVVMSPKKSKIVTNIRKRFRGINTIVGQRKHEQWTVETESTSVPVHSRQKSVRSRGLYRPIQSRGGRGRGQRMELLNEHRNFVEQLQLDERDEEMEELIVAEQRCRMPPLKNLPKLDAGIYLYKI